MDEYKVEIKETLSRIVTIEALNEDDAIEAVEAQYCDESVVLDAEDFQDVEFEVI
jgi:hypothetical protein